MRNIDWEQLGIRIIVGSFIVAVSSVILSGGLVITVNIFRQL